MNVARVWKLLAGMTVIIIAGCSDSLGPPVLKSPDPLLKVPAIKLAVEDHDRSSEAQLVSDLSSDDSAVRFYSINGLKRLTGNDLGYRYYDNDVDRRPAVQKWKSWLATRNAQKQYARDARSVSDDAKRDASSSGWTTGG